MAEPSKGMLDLVRGVSSAFRERRVNTDSTIFRLHYQLTFCILMIFTVILAANQYVGKPIRCMHHMDEQPDEVLDTFCWIHSTYTVTEAFYKEVGVEVPFPGVDNTRGKKEIKGTIRRRNRRIRGEWTSETQILLQEKQQNIFRRLGWAGHIIRMENDRIRK